MHNSCIKAKLQLIKSLSYNLLEIVAQKPNYNYSKNIIYSLIKAYAKNLLLCGTQTERLSV